MSISVVDRIRLESMLGMLGSAHVGERDNAAQLIVQFLQRRGLTWPDVLGRQAVEDDVDGKPDTKHNQASWPLFGSLNRDIVWRWLMLIGLIVVGSISLVSLIQQRAGDADATAQTRCAGVSGGYRPVLDTQNEIKSTAGAETLTVLTKPSPSFAQGLADRKIAETWHKSAPPGLCTSHFGPDREELRSACMTAEKLLTQFDQRRRTDSEYRRGWNSSSS